RFLWVHLYDPHAPYRPPAPFDAQYASDPYLGEIAAVDDALGTQLAPIAQNALLIITADHGEARGDHGELTHGLFAYEATLHVPLVVWGAGVPVGRDGRAARHVDILPTLLAAAGVAMPAPAEHVGRSLLAPAAAEPSYFEAL